MTKTKVILNITSFLIVALGLIYLILSDYYMGFDRDLIYREYIIEKEYLIYFDTLYISFFWGIIFLLIVTFFKYFLFSTFNACIFLIIFIVTILYSFDIYIRTMFFVILNIFGLIRVIILFLDRRRGH